MAMKVIEKSVYAIGGKKFRNLDAYLLESRPIELSYSRIKDEIDLLAIELKKIENLIKQRRKLLDSYEEWVLETEKSLIETDY